MVARANHKLSFKYFGPFPIIEKIGEVAYRLQLLDMSKIHPVFHVSQLKKFVPPSVQVQARLPSVTTSLQVPVQILQQRVRQVCHKLVAQGLILWSCCSTSEATWENLYSLK